MTTVNGIAFEDSDIANPDDMIPEGEYNPHNVRGWLLHDHGFTVAVVWADCLQDAMDEAVDSGKLDGFMIAESDMADYGPDEDGVARLGNAGEPFDIESLGVIEFPPPRMSITRLYGETVKALACFPY